MLGQGGPLHRTAQGEYGTALHRATHDRSQALHPRAPHPLDIFLRPCQYVARVVHRFFLQNGLVFSTCDHFGPEKTCTVLFYTEIPKLGSLRSGVEKLDEVYRECVLLEF